jgi:single-strand DNA-binding protein
MAELVTNQPVAFAGHLGSDPQRGKTDGGKTVANFDVAYTPRVRDGDEWVNGETVWYSVAAFGSTAEHVLRSLHKGDHVVVMGKQTDVEFTRKDESTGIDHKVTADQVAASLQWADIAIQTDRSVARVAESTSGGLSAVS